MTTFQKAQPGIQAKWMSGPQGSIEALFSREGTDQIYVFDQSGLLQTKKMRAPMEQMPASVKRTLDAGYANAKIEGAYKVVSRTQEKYYEVQVAATNSRERLRFDLEGQPTGKTTISTNGAQGPTASAKPMPAPAPAPVIKPATPPAANPIAMRGEAPSSPKPAPAMRGEADDMEEEEDLDIDDLLEEEEEEEWEDIDIEDDLLEEEEEGDWEDLGDDDLL